MVTIMCLWKSASFERLVIFCFGLAVALALPVTANAAIFTVTSNGDSGAGTLRAAIQTANATPGADGIDFGGAGEGTITPLTALPAITGQLGIDGGLAVTLDGSSLSSGEAALRIVADDCQIAGLTIGNFPGNGVEVGSGVANAALENNAIGSNGASGISIATGSSDASIVGNQVGTDASGTVALPNALDGIRVAGSSHQIGGASVGQGNVVSGNAGWGIDVIGGGTANPHVIRGNVIGATASGTAALPNGSGGVLVASGAPGTSVGGASVGQGNLISGNTGPGVRASANSTTVAGNLIGLEITGSSALPNGSSGVEVVGAPVGVVVGGTGNAANVISGNLANGVTLSAAGTTVKGNLIGTDSTGNTAVGNTDSGVFVAADNNRIGIAGTGNVISGNGGSGVEVDDAGDADGAIIEANRIGTNGGGTAPLPNSLAGIAAREAVTVGGTGAGAGNLISANTGPGLRLDGVDPGQTSIVRGNTIGLDLTGTTSLGNTGSGIVVEAGPMGFPTDATVGGAAAGAGNLISANNENGVLSEGTGVEIAGNRIGVKSDGTSAAGNGFSGIRLGPAAQGNSIGGDSAAEENSIFNSGGDAIAVIGAASGNQIKRNFGAGNADLFIDLGNDGVGNPGSVQGGVVAPTITAAGPLLARGTAAAGATVRVFSKATAVNGELEGYLGSATADGSGHWRADYDAGPIPLSNAKRVVATQTTVLGNTSELFDPPVLTDAVAPAPPLIQSGPDGPTSDATPTFTFPGDFTLALGCRIDSAFPVDCNAGAYTAASLGDGPHAFFVTATDLAGNTSAPASRAFTIDTQAPITTIDSGPSGPTNEATPSFGFSANESATFECRLYSRDMTPPAFAACSGPADTHAAPGVLPEGGYSFEVRATDPAGNTETSTRDFTVDITPPDTAIDSGPSGTITTDQATFTFSGTPAVDTAKIQCKLDAGAFADCTSPKTFTGLTDGTHTAIFRAMDAAGNQDPTPATSTFTVNATIYKAKIGKVRIMGPSKVKKGKKATYKVKVFNSGNADATGVQLQVKGIKAKGKVGTIAVGKSKTVKVKLKFKKPGKVKLTFKVTSSNAGGKTVKKTITVKK